MRYYDEKILQRFCSLEKISLNAAMEAQIHVSMILIYVEILERAVAELSKQRKGEV